MVNSDTTLFGWGLSELWIELFCANSPQVKDRVERGGGDKAV